MNSQNIKKVTKAVIPAAGFGTRFLPQTKAMPKEMMPLVDKPILQHVVEELVDAGITDIIIITGYHKRSIEDHFDSPNEGLIQTLTDGGEKKKHLLEQVERISSMANFYYLRQKGPKGNMTPLRNAAHLIGNEPFLYKWADDFFETHDKPSMPKQLISTYQKYNASVLACVKAKGDEDYDRFGFASGKELELGEIEVDKFIEKPGVANAPSDLGGVSCQLYTPQILNYFDEGMKVKEKYGDTEFIYTHVIEAAIADGQRFIAKEIEGGDFMDTGDKLNYLKAQVHFGLKDATLGTDFKEYLKSLNL